jgi:hypothetical protein
LGTLLPAPAGLTTRLESARITRDLAVAALPREVDTRVVARARAGWALA